MLVKKLTTSGSEFSEMDAQFSPMVIRVPVLVVSLFNGVGCAFRCYDLVGVQPMVGISYEINVAANRVTSRRWPYVEIRGDVRTLTEAEIRNWRFPSLFNPLLNLRISMRHGYFYPKIFFGEHYPWYIFLLYVAPAESGPM